MGCSSDIDKLAAALAKAQGEMRTASKDSNNPHFKSKYADLSSIWDAGREVLTKNGLSVIQLPCEAEAGYVGLRTILLHSSGQFISETARVRLQKEDAQGFGSAITYLRRYCLASAVGIVAGEDDDGNAASSTPIIARGTYEAVPPKDNSKLYELIEKSTTLEALSALAPEATKDVVAREKYMKRHKQLSNGAGK